MDSRRQCEPVREPSGTTLKLRGDLVFSPQVTSDPPCYTIEDPLRGKFYRVGIPEFTLLTLLDGRTSIAEAVGLAARRLGRDALAEHEALAVCRWAIGCQLAHPVGSDLAARLCETAAKADRQRLLNRANPLAIQIPLFDPDRLLTVLTRRCSWLFSWPAAVVWLATVLPALYLTAAGWHQMVSMAMVILDRDNWLRLAAAWVLLKVFHELAHGLACKKYGGTVPAAGVTLILLAPLAYVDVTSSWRFRSKWQRILTASAGMYVEGFIAALAVILWSGTSPGVLHQMALNVAATAGLSTLLFNGNPLVRFDGYFILSDLLGVPNLYSCGRQCVTDAIRKYVLGRPAAAPAWPRGRGWLIRTYAVAALAWRVVFYLTLALTLIGTLSHFGAVLAAALLGLGWGVPAVQMVRQLAAAASLEPIDKRRLAAAAAVAVTAGAIAALLLSLPGRVEAPAVIDYAPLTVIRAAAPGFVREIRVANGELVEPGQVIAVLENDDLAADLAELQLACRQSAIKIQMHRQNDELAKSQVELAARQAIEKKIAQTQQRIESLTVRAPVGGHLFARQLDSLAGRYLSAGDEIAILGGEEAKELIVAVPQNDVELFAAQLNGAGVVRVRTGSGVEYEARLVKVNPRGAVEPPHPALGANVGGPLAVKAQPGPRHAAEDGEGEGYQLLSPVFTVKASLASEQGRQVRSGQLATVGFRTSEETVATRWCRSLGQWVGRYTSAGAGR